mgnify:FL=1|jgi:hypothetical protein
MQFVHKFVYPVPVAGLTAEWQIAEIEGEVDCSAEDGDFEFAEVRVYALGPRIPDEIRCESKMHPLPETSALYSTLVSWLTTQHDDIQHSYEDALDQSPPDYRDSYEYEHRLTPAMVL